VLTAAVVRTSVVVVVAQEKVVAGIAPCAATMQFGAVTKAVPKVRVQEVGVPAVIVTRPEKSVPTLELVPQAEMTGDGPALATLKTWPGKYTLLVVSTPKLPVGS